MMTQRLKHSPPASCSSTARTVGTACRVSATTRVKTRFATSRRSRSSHPTLRAQTKPSGNCSKSSSRGPTRQKREFAKVAAEMKEHAGKIRADPNLGPKRRRYFEKMLAAAEAQDLRRWAHVSVEQDRHT